MRVRRFGRWLIEFRNGRPDSSEKFFRNARWSKRLGPNTPNFGKECRHEWAVDQARSPVAARRIGVSRFNLRDPSVEGHLVRFSDIADISDPHKLFAVEIFGLMFWRPASL